MNIAKSLGFGVSVILLSCCGFLRAQASQKYFSLENSEIAVNFDRTFGATIMSLVNKKTGLEFAISDADNGRLCEFIVQDRWPNPAIGEYQLKDQQKNVNGQLIVFKRQAHGWEFVKEFLVPASGSYLQVKLSARNMTGKSQEIVPLIMDRPKQGNYIDNDKTRIWMAAEGKPVSSITTHECFWMPPLDGWFALAGGPQDRVMWVSAEPEKLNLLMPQGSWHTSFTWRGGNDIVTWSYVPVVLENNQSWETTYRYCLGQGLPKVTSASNNFAVLAATQHFKERVESIELDFLGAVSGDFKILYSLKQNGKAIFSGDIKLGLKSGEALKRKIELEKEVEGFCVLDLTAQNKGLTDETLEIPLYFGEEAQWPVTRKPRKVTTSGVLVKGSAIHTEGTYYVKKRGANDFSDTKPCFTNSGVTGWWCDSLTKLHPQDKLDNKKPAPKTPRLTAVKGETVSLQLAFRNDTENLSEIEVSSTELIISNAYMPIAIENIKFYQEHYVDCYEVSDVVRGAVGPWPDAIVPVEKPISLKPNITTGLWIDIKVPRNAAAGLYDGSIIIKADGDKKYMPVVLQVADVALPVTSFLRARFSAAKGSEWIALAHRIQPAHIHEKFKEHGIYDFKAFDAKFEKMLAAGLNHFDLSLNKKFLEHLKEKGWLKLGSHYSLDEPGERRDVEWRRENYEHPHEIHPDVKVLATVQPYEFAEGTVDIWCPVSNNLNMQMIRRMQKRGDEVWWYVCCGPKWPFANLFIDYESVDHLAHFWQTYQLKLDGILYWGLNWYKKNLDPWKDPVNLVKNANGDGYFLYPYQGGYTPSIRLKILRDGVEDYDLFKMLENQIQRVQAQDPQHMILAQARELLVLDDVTLDDRRYSREPAKYLQRREKVIETLEKISKIGKSTK